MKKINWWLALEQYKIPVCTVGPICDHVTPFHFTQPLFTRSTGSTLRCWQCLGTLCWKELLAWEINTSRFCSIFALWLTCWFSYLFLCSRQCANLLFSFCKRFALQAAFLALLCRRRKKAGFLIAHFKLLYLYLGMARFWARRPELQVCC